MIVIHPKDRTTQMLELLYIGIPCQKVDSTPSAMAGPFRKELFRRPMEVTLLCHGRASLPQM